MTQVRVVRGSERVQEFDGDVVVESTGNLTVVGAISGKLTVRGSANVQGLVGSLHVLEGGRAAVNGMISGPVRVEDNAVAKFAGLVVGPVTVAPAGTFTMTPESVFLKDIE